MNVIDVVCIGAGPRHSFGGLRDDDGKIMIGKEWRTRVDDCSLERLAPCRSCGARCCVHRSI